MLGLTRSISMPDSLRRSGRSRKATTRSQNLDWGKETLRLLRESSESSNPTSADSQNEPGGSDVEFDQERQPVENGLAEDEDNPSVISGSEKSSRATTPREDEEDETGQDVIQRGPRVKPPRSKWVPPTSSHSRGISAAERSKSAKDSVWQAMFGPDAEDLKPMLSAKNRWLYRTRDVTLPSKATMEDLSKSEWEDHDVGSSGVSTSKHTIMEANDRQVLNPISLAEIRARKFMVEGKTHRLLLGPWSQQQAYDLPFLTPVSLGQAWKIDESGSSSSYHDGWFINAGEKPQCLAWSRYQHQAHYLAIACRATPSQREAVPEREPSTSPAFSRSACYPSHVQIWEFQTISGQSKQLEMDFVQPPRLSQILACSFGDVKQMTWAPQDASAQNTLQLGLLTLLTADGCMRIVRIPKQDNSSSEPACFEVRLPECTIEPPDDMIFTCFTFGSPSDLILGTSTGQVLVYNISRSDQQLEPYLQLQLHHTYLLSLCTLPNEHSHFLGSLSAEGTIRLTDLRSPFQDTVAMPRARLPTRNLIANPHTRAFIVSNDSSGNTETRSNIQTTLTAHTFRHFFSSLALARFPEGSGTATALAGSPLHPFVLVGTSSGGVWSQNAVRRILPTSRSGSSKNESGGGAWIQKVVEYEWVPTINNPPESHPDDSGNVRNALFHGPPTRQGTSRTHHGFRPQRIDLSHSSSTGTTTTSTSTSSTKKKRKFTATTTTADTDAGNNQSGGTGSGGAAAAQVIFEEEQAVTVAEWNPNPAVAAWCAIGWGSGVVLVTDLGHDVV